jgi:hypothetical protein
MKLRLKARFSRNTRTGKDRINASSITRIVNIRLRPAQINLLTKTKKIALAV